MTTVPSLSLPGSIHEPSTTSVPGTDGGTDIHVPDQSSSRNPRPSPDDEGDLYAVPKSDTEDFVGIGSLGHIIRKCFKEIYYPEQPGSSDSVGGNQVRSTKTPIVSYLGPPHYNTVCNDGTTFLHRKVQVLYTCTYIIHSCICIYIHLTFLPSRVYILSKDV